MDCAVASSSRVKFSHLDTGAIVVQIESERLLIRSYKDDDLHNSAKVYGNPNITQFFDNGKPRSMEETAKLVADIGHQYFDKGEPFGLFSIFKKQDDHFVGHIDLMPYEEKPGTLEVGYILDEAEQGQGFCTEAATTLIREYIPELNKEGYKAKGLPIKEIMATVHPANNASIRVLEKSGLTFFQAKERFGQPRNWYVLKLSS